MRQQRPFFQTKKKTEQTIFTALVDGEKGITAKSTNDMLDLATEYYQELYSSSNQTRHQYLLKLLEPMTNQLSRVERDTLDKPFELEELGDALQSTDTSSAPGPDGIQFSVLQHYWDDIGPILTRTANNIMKTGKLPQCLKRVLVTLIPKASEKDSQDVRNLRPISLSNTALKIISEAVCRRLQKVLNKLIGPYQTGFMKDRRINQNAMEFFTMLQIIKGGSDQSSSEYQAILMADFQKSFRQNFPYIHANNQEAQIFINNCHGNPFPMKCGTRQGNPLSPLIFNIALEPHLCNLNQITGISIKYDVFHLGSMKYHTFADDINICLEDLTDYETTAEIVKVYEKFSNSKINANKS
ncbi:hypothetical protein JCM33374_g5114 [Metschnikowia sp. JCM 33374]|nr:hypothetical protein JCM33374_g5114 [Metschnikowia sp. JCM 33374]